jgi:hypothetical protein
LMDAIKKKKLNRIKKMGIPSLIALMHFNLLYDRGPAGDSHQSPTRPSD